MIQFIEKLKAFTSLRNPQGCSADEVKSLTKQSEAVLPDSYRLFMELAGNGVDDFLRGSDFTIQDLEGVKEAADELLVEAGLDPLPSNAFVFVMHQGYQFYFFQDDAVYYFQEGAKQVEKRFDSFEQFFDFVIQDIDRRQNAGKS